MLLAGYESECMYARNRESADRQWGVQFSPSCECWVLTNHPTAGCHPLDLGARGGHLGRCKSGKPLSSKPMAGTVR